MNKDKNSQSRLQPDKKNGQSSNTSNENEDINIEKQPNDEGFEDFRTGEKVNTIGNKNPARGIM